MTLRLRSVPFLLSVIVILFAMVAILSVKAFAASTPSPTFSTVPAVTAAKFSIPKDGHAKWTLKLWSHGHLVGSTSGTSGVLSVSPPAAPSCGFQADVQRTEANGHAVYVSGNRTTSACCATT
jgi:hypothetical protein